MRHIYRFWIKSIFLISTLSVCVCMTLQAQAIIEQTKITVQYSEQKLEQILADLEQKSGISFFFKQEWMPTQPYSETFESTPLPEVLDRLLKNTSLAYVFYEDHAIIIARALDLRRNFTQADYLKTEEVTETDSDVNRQVVLQVGDSTQVSTTGRARISGQIRNQDNRDPLVGATIQLEGVNDVWVSDENGRFEMDIPLGLFQIIIQSIGFKNYVGQLRVFNTGDLDIVLESEAYTLKEVIIQEKASDQNIQSAQTGVAVLSSQEIKELPSFLGEADVLKSLLSLPGVSSIGEGATGINIRGGNIDQNLILQDGGIILNSSHVLGFFSIINADAIKDVTLYKGNIPAQFGGRISSVLDVRLKDADFREFQLNGGIGLVATRLTTEVPLIKDKTSLLFSGRTSYSDWILRRVSNPDVKESSASFYDITAKLSHRIGNGSTLSLLFYQTFDRFRFAQEFGYSWENRKLAFNWKQIYTPRLSSTFKAIYGQSDNTFFEPEGVAAFNLENGLDYFKVKQNFLWTPGRMHNIHFGAEWIRYDSADETLEPFQNSDSGIEQDAVPKDDGQEFGFYLNDEIILSPTLTFSIGLRYSLYQQLGPTTEYAYQEGLPRGIESIIDSTLFTSGQVVTSYSGWEPRIAMKWSLGESSSLKLSYNRLYQYIHLISNTSAATPVDIWQLSTVNIAPQQADNYSIGYFRNFEENVWETSFEVFYKDIDNLVEYKDLAQLTLNERIETELLPAIGRAYGLELSIKRKAGRLSGWFSYTYSRSERKVDGDTREQTINAGEWFSSNFDKPHNLNLALKYKLTKRHLLSVNFTYSTGRPVTAPTANYFIGNVVIPHFSPRNQFRIPDYHRLDVSYTITRGAIRKKRFKGSLTLSIYNIYGRKNAFSVFFRRDINSRNRAFKLSVLGSAFPAITYNFRF